MADNPTPGPRLELDPHLRRVVLMIGYMVLIAGFAYALSVIWPVIAQIARVLAPFIAALVVAYIFNPVVTFVQERMKLTRVGGVVVVNLFILLLLAGFIGILVPILTTQARAAYHGIEDTARSRVLPFVYRTLELDTRPEEISIGALERTVDEWIDRQQPDLRSESVREHYEELRTSVGEWVASLERTEPDEEDADLNEETDPAALEVSDPPQRLRHTTGPEDLEDLRGVVLSWTARHFRIADSTDDREEALALTDRVDEWIAGREAYLAGDIPPPSWDDLHERTMAWLEARGIDPEQVARDFAGSAQVRVAAAEGFGIVGALFAALLGAVLLLVNSAIFLFFVFLVSFYLLIDFHKLKPVVRTVCPEKHEARFFDVLKKMDDAVGGFLRGQIIVAFIVGTLTTIGLMLLGLKQYAILIGVIAGVGNLIPYLGPIIGAIPAVLWVLLTDSYDSMQERFIFLLITVGMFSLIQAFESLILQPKVVGKSASLHPVIVMMALILGAQFGILGMIIALPLTCIVRVLLKEFYWDVRKAAVKKRAPLPD